MTRRLATEAQLLALLRRADPSLPEPPPLAALLWRFRAMERLDANYRRHDLTGVLHWERVTSRLEARVARPA